MDRREATFALCTLLVFSAGPAAGRTWLVTPEGTGDFPTINAAFQGTADGDTIELADGVFRGPGNRTSDPRGREVLLRSQSGDPALCVIDAEHITHCTYIHSGEGPGLVIEGITFANGYAEYGPCGGVCVAYDSSPVFRNCVFQYNTARSNGGGMHCYESNPTLIDCVFIGNKGLTGQGGGLSCVGYPSPTVVRCRFIENSAWMGGGMECYGTRNETQVMECEFVGNTAEYYAGAFRACYTDSGNVVVTDCIFTGNHCDEWGGAVQGGKSAYVNCEFYGNTAGNEGGAAFLSGSSSGEDFIGCTFAGNYAPWCGGARYWQSYGTVANCTFYGNSTDLEGAALYVTDGDLVVVENTIIAGSVGGPAVVVLDGSSMDLSCCDIYGNAGGDWVGYIAGQYGVAGNISADPLFCGAATNDFTLQGNSPCAPHSPVNPECDLVGAWPVGCVPMSVPDPVPGVGGLEWTGIRPNPTRGGARLVFSTPAATDPQGSRIALGVFDASGRMVRRLPLGIVTGGTHEVIWDGRDELGRGVPAGVYLAKLQQGHQECTRPVIILR